MPDRYVKTNAHGRWSVYEEYKGGDCWLAEFESESLAYDLAAAPTLLEELKHTARNLRSMICMLPVNVDKIERLLLESWLERTEAAIAKAEG